VPFIIDATVGGDHAMAVAVWSVGGGGPFCLKFLGCFVDADYVEGLEVYSEVRDANAAVVGLRDGSAEVAIVGGVEDNRCVAVLEVSRRLG
jgi:hypothetical protein